MNKLYIGIDNGVTGTIGVVGDGYTQFCLTPVKKEQSYTVAKKTITRIEVVVLKNYLKQVMTEYGCGPENVMVVLERPLINPTRFSASMSASRALEAVLCVLEDLGIPRMYTDSKKWQRMLLPSGINGSDELKKASVDIACRLFPQHEATIKKHKDGDGILIAEWARRSGF